MRNISVRIILAVLLVASLGCAKVLTAKTRIDGYKLAYNKSIHGYIRGCWGFTATVKYNPETDRGSIEFGDACPPDENDVEYGINDHIHIRVYDSDGFLITTFNPNTKVDAYWSEPILSTSLSKEERRAARRIEIGFDDLYWSLVRTWVECPRGRVLYGDGGSSSFCGRECPADKMYDLETDKCVRTQVADVSSYYEKPIPSKNYASSNEKCPESWQTNGVCEPLWYTWGKIDDTPQEVLDDVPNVKGASSGLAGDCPDSWRDSYGLCKREWFN